MASEQTLFSGFATALAAVGGGAYYYFLAFRFFVNGCSVIGYCE